MSRRALLGICILSLSGCATAEQLQAQDDAQCQSYGAAPTTTAYTYCRTQLEQARQAERTARLNLLAATLRNEAASGARQSKNTADDDSPPSQAGVVCFSRGEAVSGFNKICTYNCGGSAAAITISAAELCPLTIDR